MDLVECRSDTEYADRPLALTWQGIRLEVAEILPEFSASIRAFFKDTAG